MQKLFDNSQGYETFTKLGEKKVVKFQTFILDLIKECRNEEIEEVDIEKMLDMFLNSDSKKKLYTK